MQFRSICVLGMGYIGLPTASTFATHGLSVIGVDASRRVVEVLRNGEIHIHEPGLRTLVQAAFGSGKLRVSETPEAADAFIIAVPTPLKGEDDNRADLSYVLSAVGSILTHLQPGNLVVLESTCPPRTTVDLVAPALERSGLRVGSDIHLAYTPERVLPGRILQELIENARVIGGVDVHSAEVCRELYTTFAKGEIFLTDATTAEMVKLMENTYRDVNIAVANEFAKLAERFEVNVWEAIGLANRHPRVRILRPGPGVGGHCLSVDPWFLVEAAPEITPLIRQARLVNDHQPAHTVQLIRYALDGLEGRRIAALGLAYKPDVDDLRRSPAVAVVRLLVEAGAAVRTFDPLAPGTELPGAQSAASLEEALDGAEAVVLLVGHRIFRQLDPKWAAASMPGRKGFDASGSWSRSEWQQAGFEIHTLGMGRQHAAE